MFKLFPEFENKELQVKHNTLVSYALLQILNFVIIALIAFNNFLDLRIFIITVFIFFFMPVLAVFFARYRFKLISRLYTGISLFSSIIILFLIQTFDNASLAIFVIVLFVISLLITLSVSWKSGIASSVLVLLSLIIDHIFETKGILNIIAGKPLPTIYYLFIISSYLISTVVMGIAYKVSFYTIFKVYISGVENKKEYESQLKEKNISLNKINLELEKNMSLLEELIEKNESALKKAEESDKLKTSFLQNISHEVRTPLNAIIGFLNLIKEENIKSNYNLDEYINPTINAGYQLLNVISDIIELSQFDAGTVEITNYRFDINNLLKEIYIKTKDSCESKGLKFILENSLPGNIGMVKSDPWRISQILNNLLSNAVKFTYEGHIKLSTSINDDTLVFIVKDTGIGINQDQMDEIFKRFKKIEKESINIYGGLGIGLTIAKELALRMNGKIKVKSKIDFGSEFIVELPYISEVKVEDVKDQRPSEFKDIKKILIAEDDVSNFKYINTILGAYKDIEVYHAWNGKEAVDIFNEQHDIDIVLMDIKMPVMDGVESFHQIKKIRSEVPIFAVTAYALNHEKTKYLNYGFDGYLTKPVKKGEILGLLQLAT